MTSVSSPLPLPSGSPSGAPAIPRRSESEKIRTLQGRLTEATEQARDRADLLQRVGRVLTDAARTDLLAIAKVDSQGQIVLDGILHPIAGLPEATIKSFQDSARVALQDRQTRIGRIGRPPNQLLITVPILSAPIPEAVLALFLAPIAAPDVLTTVMELAVATISGFDIRRCIKELEQEAANTAAIVDLAARVQAASSVSGGAQTLVDDTHQHLAAIQMAVGVICPGESACRLAAVSRGDGHISPDRRDAFLEAALDECLLREDTGIWPPPPGVPRHSLSTHKQLSLHWKGESVVSVPLRTHQGEIVGAWLAILKDANQALAVAGFLQAAAPLVGAALQTLQRGEKGRLSRGIASVIDSLRRKRGRWIAIAVACLTGALWIPLPYSVRASCEIHPVSLRYVAAPFDARLLQAEVEPGDEVAVGQLLARLDGEEIHFELSGATAEVDRAAKERDGHLADKEINAAQVSRLEMARMNAKASVLRQRSEQLEIRSPVEGVVIAGDLRRAEGAPLSTGQTLFEIAPLEEMVLEIGIPEEDISHTQVGQSVEAILNALPDRQWTGTIQRIHPRSELVDQDYVFIAEVHFTNEHGLLRPGMKGRAKIVTAKHPLGWNLFHKAIDQVRFWAGW